MKFSVSVLCALFLLSSPAFADARKRGMTVATDISLTDIQALGEYKTNIVRYPLTWLGRQADNATVEAYNAWLSSKLDELDLLIPAFQAEGIKVIINMQTPPGGYESESGKPQVRMFSELAFQRAFITAWQTIAARYKSNTAIYGYDVLNEPAQAFVGEGLKSWNQLAAEVAADIRAIDTTHIIYLEPRYGDPGRLSGFTKVNVPGVVYSIHMYYPISFQHQGIYGRTKKVSYPTKSLNKRHIAKFLKKVQAFQKKVKGKIWVGEFSSVRWAPKKSSYNYLKDVLDIFEKNKWDWSYHAFREADAWSLEHGGNQADTTRSPTPTDRQKLIMKYFKRNSL